MSLTGHSLLLFFLNYSICYQHILILLMLSGMFPVFLLYPVLQNNPNSLLL